MADVFTKQKRKPILGYDVKHGPCELQFAAEVTLQSLDPNFEGSGLGGFIGKMMLAAEVTALQQALGKAAQQRL